MSKLLNFNAWANKIASEKKAVKSKATKYVQDTVRKVYKEAVKVSPQWSGNFAYNWALEFGSHSQYYTKRFKITPWNAVRDPSKDGVHSAGATARVAGDPVIVNAAVKDVEDIIMQIKWNHKIRLVNHTPIAEDMAAGRIRLRPANTVSGTHAVVEHLKTKFKFLKSQDKI